MIEFTRLDHVLLSIPPGKTADARLFYGVVLALPEIPGEHPGGAIWFTIADTQLHLCEEPESPLSARHPAFEVADLAAARQTLTAQGVPITDSSVIDGRDRFFFRDPFGNRIELLQHTKYRSVTLISQ